MMNKRDAGAKKEDEVARFLTECGLKIKELNFRNRFGEIDIIAKDGDYTVFVEVKERLGGTSRRGGKCFKSQDHFKGRRLLYGEP